MKTRRLGKTGLVVSEICLGTMTFGSFSDEKESHAILDRADSAGVDFLDVAEIYPVPPDPKWSGRSEEIVGSWLEKRGSRDTLFVATKIAGPSGGWFRAAVRGGRTALDRHNVATAIEGSLRRLRTDYIDLYQTHWVSIPTCPATRSARRSTAVQAGKVRYLGLQQRVRVRADQEPGVSAARGIARYETIQNNFAAQPPLRGRARERMPAREGEPPAVQPDRGRRALGQVPGRRVPRGRALLALQEERPARPDHGAPLHQREDDGVDRALHEARRRGRARARHAGGRLDARARLRGLDHHRRDVGGAARGLPQGGRH
jgi:hypothetical protein